MEEGLFDGLPPPAAAPAPVPQSKPQLPAAPEPVKPAIKSKRPGDQLEGPKQVRFKTSSEISEQSAIDAMRKIAAHIGNPAKFSKASKLALQLLTGGKVTSQTSEVFFTLLEASMNPPSKANEAGVRADYKSLFSALEDKAEVFTPVHREQLEVWFLWANLANDFHTDDTFVFSRAATRLRQEISSLPETNTSEEDEGEEDINPSSSSRSPEAEVDPFGLNALFQDGSKKNPKKNLARERREALIQCLIIGTSRYKHQWAQTILDMTCKHAGDNMSRFAAGVERERVEKLCLSVKEQQVKRKQGKSNTGKLDVTTFERYGELYANEKISIRKAVGASGDRSAEQWLG